MLRDRLLLVQQLEPRFEAGWVRPAVITGFLGAYTTVSTLSLDTYRLLERWVADPATTTTELP